MEIADFFEPVDHSVMQVKDHEHPLVLGKAIRCHSHEEGFPDLEGVQIALLGVAEDRRAMNNTGCALAPNKVRTHLYQLFQGSFKLRIADLGNIRRGDQLTDTYFAVKKVVSWLIKKKITPVIIGGSQDISYANYQAYEELGQIINLVAVDSRFDIGIRKDEKTHHRNYLSTILTHQPNYLFNYVNIGYQTYFVDQDAIELMEKLYFDTYRLGVVRKDLEEVEPIVRNADMLSFDISCVRQPDAPGNANASPNGFSGEEACQIIRYAGLSDKLSSIGIYEINPSLDHGDQTTHLAAQMIWYFLDGYFHRKNDMPDRKRKDAGEYIKYVVSIKDFKDAITFYKSKKSDRWWMEVPYPSGLHQKYERQFLVSCSYNDYLAACQDEMPEKWWQVYQKFL
jgi:formiminoglutamase